MRALKIAEQTQLQFAGQTASFLAGPGDNEKKGSRDSSRFRSFTAGF
jgi:hypothetical protein